MDYVINFLTAENKIKIAEYIRIQRSMTPIKRGGPAENMEAITKLKQESKCIEKAIYILQNHQDMMY